MPEPIGEPSGITAAQPTSSRRRARIGSSFVYGSTTKPSSTSSSAASSSAGASGSSVRSSPITSSLTQSVSNASRASLAVSTASRAVKQPAVLGSSLHAGAVEHVDDRAALGRVDAAQRDGDELGAGRLERGGQRVERAEAAGAEQQPRAQLVARDGQDVGVRVGDGHLSLPGSRAGSPPAPLRAAPSRPTAPRGTTSASTATATPRPAPGRSSASSAACDGRAVVELGLGSPLRTTFMRAPPRSAAGRRARPTPAAARRPAPSPTRSAVTGVSRMPLRKWPVAQTRPSSAPGPIAGRLSGVAGRRPAISSSISSSKHAGDELARCRAAARRRRPRSASCPSRAPPSSRRARSGRRRAGRSTRARRGSCARRARAVRVAQPQHLALDRAHRHARVLGHLEPRDVARPRRRRRRPRRSSPPSATHAGHALAGDAQRRDPRAAQLAGERAAQRRDELARVDRVVGRRCRARAGPSARAPARARRACDGRSRSTGSPSSRAERGEAIERLGLVAVAGDDQRADRAVAGVVELGARTPA